MESHSTRRSRAGRIYRADQCGYANRTAPTTTNGQGLTLSNTAGEAVPKALSDAGEYDLAKLNDWKKADAKLALLKEAVKKGACRRKE